MNVLGYAAETAKDALAPVAFSPPPPLSLVTTELSDRMPPKDRQEKSPSCRPQQGPVCFGELWESLSR